MGLGHSKDETSDLEGHKSKTITQSTSYSFSLFSKRTREILSREERPLKENHNVIRRQKLTLCNTGSSLKQLMKRRESIISHVMIDSFYMQELQRNKDK